MCLSELTCFDKLLVSSFLITPTEVVLDGTGEDNVLLKYYGYCITESLKVVFSYVDTCNLTDPEVTS